MVSKGVNCYAYVSTNSFKVEFLKPGVFSSDTYKFSDPGKMQLERIEITPTTKSPNFKWNAFKDNRQIATHFADISSVTGNLGDSDLGNMMTTPSVIDKDYALSYGFYDASPGYGALTNRDQAYVYLTDNYSNWMGDLMNANPDLKNQPFAVFALPGAHDAGMFDLTCVARLITSAEFLSAAFVPLGAVLVGSQARRAIVNLAFTQKDTVTTMLNLGMRYFDFRPGFCYQRVDAAFTNGGGIYHQHAVIPGYSYQSFLTDVLSWLKLHPNEMVVINANFQGFSSDSMKPSTEQLESTLKDAQASTGTQDITIGGKGDLNCTVKELIAHQKRLIFLNQLGNGDYEATKDDSYNDGYQTTKVDVVLDALNILSNTVSSADYIVLQLQGTATGADGGLPASILTLSDATSPLMSSKAAFDHQTYPWLLNNVPTKFPKDKLIVFLNDFVDNALVSHAIEVTKRRFLNNQG